MPKIGIIGGSGLDNPEILQDPKQIEVDTEYGKPSSSITTGTISGIDVAILARHGKNHKLSPTQVNNRANILALKNEGVTHILATTACGSLREEIERGHFVVLDQFIDFTKFRKTTFFDSFQHGIEHPIMADPFNERLRMILTNTARELKYQVHGKGTVVSIEGPRFSTRAESHMFRSWGADVINMTTAPEAMLANEVQIPYAAIAMATDYDCWKEDEKVVTWQEILEVFNKNVEHVKQVLINSIPHITI